MQLKQQNSVGIQVANVPKKEMDLYNANLTEKKLKDFGTKEDLLLMNSLIIRWAKYIGVTVPEASELNMLSNFIKENFATLNASDIKECISLLVTDKLDTDAEPYGKLSPIYVSKVFKAYQIYKSEVFSKIRVKIQKQVELDAPKPTNEQRVANFKILLKQAKETVSQNEYFNDFGDLVYSFIKKNKLVFMPDLVEEAMKFANESFLKKAQGQSLKNVINGAKFTHFDKDALVKGFAREYVANFWLKNTDVLQVAKGVTFEMIE